MHVLKLNAKISFECECFKGASAWKCNVDTTQQFALTYLLWRTAQLGLIKFLLFNINLAEGRPRPESNLNIVVAILVDGNPPDNDVEIFFVDAFKCAFSGVSAP